MAGRDLSAELFGDSAPSGGRDLTKDLFGTKSVKEQIDNDEISRSARNFTDTMSGVDKFRAGWGKAVTDMARGAGQWIGAVSREDVAESRKRDEALLKTGAGTAGNIAGNIATLAPTMFIPGVNTIPGAMALGAVTGAIQPSVSGEETAKNIGLGAATSAAVPTLITGGKVAKSFVEPLYQSGRDQIIGRALRTAAGNQADDAMRNLAGASPSVTGAMPTAAEVAQNPGLAAMQRTATAVDPVAMNELAARQLANNEARIAALRSIIGDKAASVQAREAATEALYAAANGKTITLTPELESLLARPQMQSALSSARNLAANEGRPFSLRPSTPPQPSSMVGPNGRPLGVTPGTPGSMLTQDAHTMKRALDDVIENLAGADGLGKNARRAAVDNKNALLNAVEAQVPEYGAARTTFAQLSKPVNQAEVAQAILERSTNNVQGTMTPAAFNRAFSDRTAQSALGRTNATLADTFTPQQMAVLKAIGGDLKGLDFANTAGRGVGSDTVQKLAFSNMMARSGLPGWVSNFAPASIAGNLAQKAGNVVYGDANKKMAEQLARSMLDPKTTAELMKKGVTPQGLLALEEGAIRGALPLTGGLLALERGQ